MAKNISLLGADYPDVPAVDLPITGGGTARFVDADDFTPVQIVPTNVHSSATIVYNASYKIGKLNVVNLRIQTSSAISAATELMKLPAPKANPTPESSYGTICISNNRNKNIIILGDGKVYLNEALDANTMYLLHAVYVEN